MNKILMVLLLVSTFASAKDKLLPRPADIGPDWQGGTGVVIEDLSNPPTFFAQSMAKVIKQYKSIGVISMANLAYRKRSNPMHQVELKLFTFESIEKAQAWQHKKYGYDNWQQHYKHAEQDGLDMYDSLQISKRIVFFKNYWITASTITDTNDHLVFLDHVYELLKHVALSSKNKSQ